VADPQTFGWVTISTFLTGAWFTNVIGSLVATLRARRDERIRQDSELHRAYEEFMASLEESRVTLLRVALTPRPDGEVEHWVQYNRVLLHDVVMRICLARARILLLDDDSVLREHATNCAQQVLNILLYAPLASPLMRLAPNDRRSIAFKAKVQAVVSCVQTYQHLVASCRSAARANHASVFPMFLAGRQARQRVATALRDMDRAMEQAAAEPDLWATSQNEKEKQTRP